MKTPCLYSILRYAPNTDTGEFVNAGVVICAPQQRLFLFMLAKKNDSRINTFFSNDPLFPAVKAVTENTLKQAQRHIRTLAGPEAIGDFFRSLTALRESVLSYSPVGVVMSDDPQEALKTLFTRCVSRPTVAKVRREEELNRALRETFQEHDDLSGVFHPDTLGKELTRFSVPFVARIDHEILCVIKPLTFLRKTPARMIEHCDKWVTKITRAAEEKILRPGNVLLPLELPTNPTPGENKAIVAIRKTFERHYLTYTRHNDADHIVSFARRAMLAAKPYI